MVQIELFSKKHVDNTYTWMQDHLLKKSFLFRRHVSPEDHQVWFETVEKSTSEKIYGIHFDEVHVGNLGLKNIDLTTHDAETWVYIGLSDVKSKGVASMAYEQLFTLLKTEGKILFLYCHIASFNTSSISLYKRLGFEQVTSFQEKQDWEGEEYDLLKFSKTL